MYDVAIVGAGPCGMAAAIYGWSEALNVVLLEGNSVGGQAGQSSHIENYPGFPAGLTGESLTRRCLFQIEKFGGSIRLGTQVLALEAYPPGFQLLLSDQSTISARSVLLANGVSYRQHPAAGIHQFQGRGVFYGLNISQGPQYRDRLVYVVGGGNSAGQAAVCLSRFARQVTLLVRRSSLNATMSYYLIRKISLIPSIAVCVNCQVATVSGNNGLERLTLNVQGREHQQPADGLFLFIGAEPKTEWLPAFIERDCKGFIKVGNATSRWPAARPPFSLETSMPGVFAAGDIRAGSIKRVAAATGDGATAAAEIGQFLHGLWPRDYCAATPPAS